MSRKVYYADTPQRRRVKQEAILILRQTRGLIDHELLERARAQITNRMAQVAAKAAPRENAEGEALDESFEAIDRQKNMATIMKFIEMKSDNKAFMHEMKSLLQQSQH